LLIEAVHPFRRLEFNRSSAERAERLLQVYDALEALSTEDMLTLFKLDRFDHDLKAD